VNNLITKSSVTNILSCLITLIGYFMEPGPVQHIVWTFGVFAVSGAITNWIAIYMLFDKVPLCYGSGVIPNRFEEFKSGIKRLVINEFFTLERVESFFKQATLSKDSSKLDYNKAFDKLVEAIATSQFGSFLAMMGGSAALEPMRESIIGKMQEMLTELLQAEGGVLNPRNVTSQIEEIVDNRLAELTPNAVKDIIQTMIREHLGWLVVWGGVFGGLLGIVVAILE
jgi:uncharacterized membrane protein YheB (UPF0754 family)